MEDHGIYSLTVNKPQCTDAATVSDLISALDIRDNVAVEVNREIVSRSAFAQHTSLRTGTR